MISMTGYGRAEVQDATTHTVVEVKSVNNRYLDVNVTLPSSLGALELPLRDKIGKLCSRGRIDLYIRHRVLEEELRITVDRSALSAHLASLQVLKEALKTDEQVTLDHVLQAEGVLKSERSVDPDQIWAQIEPVADEAFNAFVATRKAEGQRLYHDISGQIDSVADALRTIERSKDQIDVQVRSNLRDRFRDVVGDAVEEPRMLAEVAVQLTRFSIHEEIVRLAGHLESFRRTMDDDKSVGKSLDFRCQEMHREVNTIGSKSIVLEISEQVIAAKQAIENVREQLRNVE